MVVPVDACLIPRWGLVRASTGTAWFACLCGAALVDAHLGARRGRAQEWAWIDLHAWAYQGFIRHSSMHEQEESLQEGGVRAIGTIETWGPWRYYSIKYLVPVETVHGGQDVVIWRKLVGPWVDLCLLGDVLSSSRGGGSLS